MPKINVYVPDALLERVRAEGIAVSSVCQDALSAQVQAQLLARAATRDIRAVARRLRQTHLDAQIDAEREGFEFGVEWARESATLDELERVERAVRRGGSVSYRRVPTLMLRIHKAAPDADVDPDDELDADDSAFARGVLAGAAEVYRAAAPLLAGPLTSAPRRVHGGDPEPPRAPRAAKRVRGRPKGPK